MNDDADRRRSARVFREFPAALTSDAGEPLDPRATAHDVSEKGFKIESRAELTPGQFIRFVLSLSADDEVRGRARIVWSERADLSYWAGCQFVKLSWRGRRRVRRVMSPSEVDWDRLADKSILALSALLTTLLGWKLLSNAMWRHVLGGMLPTALAAFAMGWALRALLLR